MGKGRLTWNPSYKAVQLDATHYLQLYPVTVLNPLTQSFRIAVLVYIDSTISNPSQDRCIVSKWDGNLASDTGYRLYYNPTDLYVAFEINDGDATPATIQSANGVLSNNSWNVLVVEIVRNGTAIIYKNGVSVASGDISAKSGSISNSSPFTVGDVFSGGSKGYVGWLNVNFYLGSATNALEEYYRVIYGHRELRTGCLYPNSYNWSMNGTLVSSLKGLSKVTYTLLCETAGTPVYYDYGLPWSINFDFIHNPKRGRQHSYLSLDSVVRTINGDLYYYENASKWHGRLEFGCQYQQMIAIESAWLQKSALIYYPDYFGTSYESSIYYYVYMIAPPQIKQIYNAWYEVSVELEQR
jgi:hypothetical protein